MTPFSEKTNSAIEEVQVKLHYLLEQLQSSKDGNRAAAQRFRVNSVIATKLMKTLRRLMLDDK